MGRERPWFLNSIVFSGLHSKAACRLARHTGSLLVSIVAILAVTGVAFGESASSAESAPAPVGLDVVALEGSVRSESGEPLVGALVSLFGSKLGSAGLIAFTDEKGRFLIAGLEPGYYTIRAYLSGFLPSRYSGYRVRRGPEHPPLPSPCKWFRLERKRLRPQSFFKMFKKLRRTRHPRCRTRSTTTTGLPSSNGCFAMGKKNILNEQAASLSDASKEPVLVDEVAAYPAEPTGELGLFAFERGLNDLPASPGELDAQLAYARLSIPTGPASEWIVSAQLLESALSSWAARAEFRIGALSRTADLGRLGLRQPRLRGFERASAVSGHLQRFGA